MKERLTRRNEYGFAELINKTGKSFDLSSDIAYAICPDDEFLDIIQEVVEKLSNYEDLEERGKLVEFPCAVGDKIYRIIRDANFPIIELRVSRLFYENAHMGIEAIAEAGLRESYCIFPEDYYFPEDFSDIVFLTKEEAEARRRELRGEQE